VLISDSLASYAGQGDIESLTVGNFNFAVFAIIETKTLLIEITEQMERFNGNISTMQTALYKRPEIFDAVSVDFPMHVSLSMVHDLMNVIFVESPISVKIVSVQSGSGFDVLFNQSLQGAHRTILNYLSLDFAIFFQHASDNNFIAAVPFHFFSFAFVHVARFSADESFVNLDRRTASTKFHDRTVLHRKPDSVKHEPCRLLSYANGASDLARRNPIAAIGKHPHHRQPLLKRNRRIFKDGSDLRGELAFLVSALALPFALILQEHNILPSTGRTGDSIWPQFIGHVVESIVRVGEINNRVLQGLYLVGFAFHESNYEVLTLICQVYNHH
jgi:hypothetical protein